MNFKLRNRSAAPRRAATPSCGKNEVGDRVWGFDPVQPARHAFGLAADGGLFVGFNNDGTGVMKISADGQTCEILSRWASRNLAEPLPDIGGFTPQYGTITGLLHHRGRVIAQTHDVLLVIDDQTGDRTVWGSGDGIGGVGEANFIVDEARNVLIACGGEAPRKCSVHHLQDGVPAQGLFQVGQAQPLLPGLYPQTQGSRGALENGAVNAWGAVVMHPDDPNVLFFTVISGFIKYEIDTGNNFLFSL